MVGRGGLEGGWGLGLIGAGKGGSWGLCGEQGWCWGLQVVRERRGKGNEAGDWRLDG